MFKWKISKIATSLCQRVTQMIKRTIWYHPLSTLKTLAVLLWLKRIEMFKSQQMPPRLREISLKMRFLQWSRIMKNGDNSTFKTSNSITLFQTMRNSTTNFLLLDKTKDPCSSSTTWLSNHRMTFNSIQNGVLTSKSSMEIFTSDKRPSNIV